MTRWLRGFKEWALHKVLVPTFFFFLFVRDMLPLPQPALAFSPRWTHSLPAGRAATAIATGERLRGGRNLHRAKLFDIKHVYQAAAGMLTCWKGPFRSVFFNSGKGEDQSSEASVRGSWRERYYTQPLSTQTGLSSQSKPSGTSSAALLPSSHLWDTPPKL